MTSEDVARPERPRPRLNNAATTAKIWDLPTRLFHWLLVLSVAISAKTGFFGPANSLDWHVWSGYAIGVLIVWRLIWGLFGSEFSRLDRLFGALRRLPEHIAGLVRLSPKHYLGHNPAGSLMILALICVLFAILVTGLVVLGGVEKQGPLVGMTGYDIGHLAKGVHQILAYLLMVMILGHLLGVLTEVVLLRVPLVRGMVTGRLPVPADVARGGWRGARPAMALAGSLAAAAAIGIPLFLFASLPAHGVPAPVPANSVYAKECGACHWSFHPSLLPRASWKLLMSRLDRHFGEDASLSAAAAAEISSYLDANAAETADTEPANRLREVSTTEPDRITRTRFWQRVHGDLPAALFGSPAIKSKVNCAACHRDALSGRFDDQAIDIPLTLKSGDTN